MYSLEKCNPLKRERLASAGTTYGLVLTPLAERYGINFVLKLIWELTRRRKNPPLDNRIPVLKLPREERIQRKIYDTIDAKKKRRLYKKQDQAHEEYFTLLQQAGFTFYEWKEDFIDEDTGEVVSVPRKHIYLLKRKNPT